MFKIFQKGFHYSQDGHGNRLVYHLYGCNLHCPWCANPEGLFPHGVKTYLYMSAREIVEEAISAKPLFFEGGGVTFTGGEPTLQFDDLLETLKLLKGNGIHTCIENNGTCVNLNELLPYIDELIIDFKHYDSRLHREVIGSDNDVIKKNLNFALKNHGDVLIRTVLINHFNTSDRDLGNFIRFFKDKDTSHTRFEFLPYHEYGKVKWEQCGKPYRMTNALIDKATLIKFESEYQKNHFKVVRT